MVISQFLNCVWLWEQARDTEKQIRLFTEFCKRRTTAVLSLSHPVHFEGMHDTNDDNVKRPLPRKFSLREDWALEFM